MRYCVLQNLLDRLAAPVVKNLVVARTDGATPLVVACRNGHFDVAQYLLDKCNADLEQTGSVTFDGETIEGAPPLWCASAAGNLDIVKLLISRGANVNATTKTNSTPLRAACFDGHFSIVKYLIKQHADIEIANRHGHTCLMIACYKGHYDIAKYLLQLGANVNRKSVKGNTALHDCAESGSLLIMMLLLRHGATIDVDSYGMTPLLAAAVTGHSHIVDYLIGMDFISPRERIEAMELLGATFMDKKRDMLGAASLWKRALQERKLVNLPKPPTQSPIAAFGGATEINSEADLEDVMSDPDAMRIQALIIRERILGPAHPDTSYFIRYRGAVYADAGNIPKCITLWLYALRMQQEILEPLSLMTQSSLSSFAELFSYILSKRISASVPMFVPDLIVVFEQALAEWKRGNEHVQARKAHNFDVDKETAGLTFMEIYEQSKSEPSTVQAPPLYAGNVPMVLEIEDQAQNGMEEEEVGDPVTQVKPLQYVTLQCLAARAINRHKVPFDHRSLPLHLIAMVVSHGY
ncbi:unnamed protein product [Notodromas monacha]|uniref:Uncharacterized protein n=1 Tax=Notodromas monacha TaxID=399045 RepID=A0A7R9GB18_9CRUS|nr:unnamed protein product [Notodromas monacha]CAG0914333.1 unnamed protein product [Notodromas monacha]